MVSTEQIKKHLTGILDIPFEEVDSSNILLQGYNEEGRILYLVFRPYKEGQAPQWVYQYKVNPVVYKNFLKAESKGKFFSDIIKQYAICKSPLNFK